MTKYFYSNGQDKEGPVTLEELKQANIKPGTLVWHEGLDDWKDAESIHELCEIFELSPPPIENGSQESNIIESNKNTTQLNSNNIPSKWSMFSNVFSFEGRIRRTEYGISVIIFVLITVVVNEVVKSGNFPIIVFAYIPMYWFLWAQGAKRCHDIGNSGWYQIIPFYIFWLIFATGDSWFNKYGRCPKN